MSEKAAKYNDMHIRRQKISASKNKQNVPNTSPDTHLAHSCVVKYLHGLSQNIFLLKGKERKGKVADEIAHLRHVTSTGNKQ
jgi:hypothetical protein